jgi:hypothetical protein
MSTQAPHDMMTTLARHGLIESLNALYDAQNKLEDEEGVCSAALTAVVRDLKEGQILDRDAAQRLAQTINVIWRKMTQSTLALHVAQVQFNIDVVRALKK